jgi:hypothetical protein
LVRVAGYTFEVELKSTSSPGVLTAWASALRDLRGAAAEGRVVPLVVVPYMTEAGRKVCEEAGLSWLDLSGNARIIAPGLRVIIDGQANRFRGPGRPASLFAPKSARVSRWLLQNAGRASSQRQIAHETGMSEGFVSRIVSGLLEESYVHREAAGGLTVKSLDVLLDAWRAEYRFDRHSILEGHVGARSGDGLTRFVCDTLRELDVPHAATGLSAAWQLTQFASFRTASIFVKSAPSRAVLERLGFRQGARGANTWLVVPDDEGVFLGGGEQHGVQCVHPVQVYLDLKAHHERSNEAASRVRQQCLQW